MKFCYLGYLGSQWQGSTGGTVSSKLRCKIGPSTNRWWMYWLTSSKLIPGWIVETGIEYNPITLWTIPTSLITKKFHFISHKRGVQTIVYLRETTTQSTVLHNIIQKARTVIVIHLYLLFINSINLFELFDTYWSHLVKERYVQMGCQFLPRSCFLTFEREWTIIRETFSQVCD